MTLPPITFQFHDIATVEAWSDAPFARTFFEAEYGYHRVGSPSSGLPRAFLDFRLDSAPPEGFTRHTHKLLARWGYRLTVKPGDVDIHVYGNRTSVSMAHHMLVHPSLRWLAAGGGTLLLHAGAVAKNGKSLIFTGKGGAGKTTTTSLILASDSGRPYEAPLPTTEWQLHADDYVFLRPGPKSLAYVTRSHLYRDLLKWVPEVGARLTPWERIRLEFFGALRKYSGERIKWPVRLGPQRLWPQKTIADTATPAAILLLERANVSGPQLIPVTDLPGTVNELLEMNFGEARHFLTLLKKAGQLDESWLAAWRDSERNLMAKILAEVPTYRLILPFSQSAQDVKATLVPILENLVGA
jgi:hypothetical protein